MIEEIIKIIISIAIIFVWFIRYDNIRKEFSEYNYPNWLRDFIGILKISFIVMLHSRTKEIELLGISGLFILMLGAVLTHIKIKSEFKKYIASVIMLILCIILLNSNI
tara:strand:+ start:2029 stop:2352 length:324 start_codon:yes stop_codon:yes gene_type:complete